MTSTCKTCKAPIRWAMTETGERMPLDEKPLSQFTLEERWVRGTLLVVAVSATVYQPHFATCPDADQHRAGE